MRTVNLNRATSVYLIMVAILAAGLWVIFAFGSTLRPPTDLAGKWELTGPAGTQEMTIEQSGRFVHLALPQWSGDLKIQHDSSQSASQTAGVPSLTMAGNGATIEFVNLTIDEQCTLRFEGPVTGTYQARRTVRAYPKLISPTPHSAAATTRPSGEPPDNH